MVFLNCTLLTLNCWCLWQAKVTKKPTKHSFYIPVFIQIFLVSGSIALNDYSLLGRLGATMGGGGVFPEASVIDLGSHKPYSYIKVNLYIINNSKNPVKLIGGNENCNIYFPDFPITVNTGEKVPVSVAIRTPDIKPGLSYIPLEIWTTDPIRRRIEIIGRVWVL